MDVLPGIANFIRDTGTLSNATRNTARQKLREWLEDRIYLSRRPQKNDQDKLSLQLEYANGVTFYSLEGEIDATLDNVQATLRMKETRQQRAQLHVRRAMDKLALLLTGYRGTFQAYDNSAICIETITHDAPNDLTEQPLDGSDSWTIGLSMVFQVYHEQETTIAS